MLHGTLLRMCASLTLEPKRKSPMLLSWVRFPCGLPQAPFQRRLPNKDREAMFPLMSPVGIWFDAGRFLVIGFLVSCPPNGFRCFGEMNEAKVLRWLPKSRTTGFQSMISQINPTEQPTLIPNPTISTPILLNRRQKESSNSK